MKNIFLLSLLVLIGFSGFSQTYKWTKTFGGNQYDEGNGIAIDDLGNLYITGSFSSTCDFDPGAGTQNATSNGQDDIFILKLDSLGNFIWVKTIGGTGFDLGHDIAVNGSDLYITGEFEDSADFDPSASTHFIKSEGNEDIFILKMDTTGNFAWAHGLGATGGGVGESGRAINVDPNGNVVVTGLFTANMDFDPGPGQDIQQNNGFDDVFVLKLNAQGQFVWVKTFGGPASDMVYDLAFDASSNIYSAGFFNDSVDFDPGANMDMHYATIWENAFVHKLGASGNFMWARSFGSDQPDGAEDVEISPSGHVYVTGYFSDTADLDPGTSVMNFISNGQSDAFVQKLTPSGNLVWVKAFGGQFTEEGYEIHANGNAIFTSGTFSGTVDFDPGSGTDNHSFAGDGDAFMQKLDTAGDFEWAVTFGGPFEDDPWDFEMNSSGSLYATGRFRGISVDFDPTSAVDTHTAVGDRDVFVWKLFDGNVTGISEVLQETTVKVFPNPTTGNVSITLNNDFQDGKFILTDLSGQIIKSGRIEKNIGFEIELPTSPNIYLLKIISEEKIDVVKILKQ